MTERIDFDAKEDPLQQVLAGIGTRSTQLPDFQRGWVWDDSHIRSLLASISLGYPIGAVMLLQAGGADKHFKTRLVEGVAGNHDVPAQVLILDGQQRLTSLYQALCSGQPVTTHDGRGRKLLRHYYVDIRAAIDPLADREDAIVGIPEDRQVRNFRNEIIADYSTRDLECRAELMPISLVFNTGGLMTWQMQYLGTDTEARMKRWAALLDEFILPFQQYMVPVIFLGRNTPKEAVCQVFEKVNTGGVPLTVFELVTASFAAEGDEDFALRDDWMARKRRFAEYKVLDNVQNTDFLQCVTLLATFDRRRAAAANVDQAAALPPVACQRRDILRLSLADYKRWAPLAEDGFQRAAKFLHRQHVFASRDVPYQTQLVPLAAVLGMAREAADTASSFDRLSRWYWCGVFGELYGSAVESRFAKDTIEVMSWLSGGPEPTTVGEALFAPSRLLTLRSRLSAAYKGLSALLLRDHGVDWLTKSPIEVNSYFEEAIDIHHIFPKRWCESAGLPASDYDSVINKAPLSARTNRIIGGEAPTKYLPRLQERAGVDEATMDGFLRSHAVEPVWLRSDDYFSFKQARAAALVERIASAMGKPTLGVDTVRDAPSEFIADEGEIA